MYKASCSARTLTDRYYTFEFTSKVDPADVGVITCGRSCGKHFLELLQHPPVRLFDPLLAPARGPGTSTDDGATNDRPYQEPLNEELWCAINLYVAISGIVPRAGLAATLDFLRRNPGFRTQDRFVLYFNTHLEQEGPNTTLLSEVRQRKGLKTFEFPLIKDVLARNGQRDFCN